MRPNHTATDFAPPQPLLATPMDATDEAAPSRHASAFTRATFCFAWLFGLEPFLTGSANEASRSSADLW